MLQSGVEIGEASRNTMWYCKKLNTKVELLLTFAIIVQLPTNYISWLVVGSMWRFSKAYNYNIGVMILWRGRKEIVPAVESGVNKTEHKLKGPKEKSERKREEDK